MSKTEDVEEDSGPAEDLKPKPPSRLAPRGIKTFTVCRQKDETGVSGEGVVIEGVLLASGHCIVHWLYPPPRGGIAIFDSLQDFEKVHIKPHPTNKTILTFEDGEQAIYEGGLTMSYKFRGHGHTEMSGTMSTGDIIYTEDSNTKIDFDEDYIALNTAGNSVLVVSGSDVGIGTSAPTQNLHVVGAGNTTLRVQGSDGYYGALNVKGGTGDSAWLWQPANTSELRFFTVDDDRMVILGSGEIGVGTTAPKAALDVHHNPTGLSNDTGGGEVVTFGGGSSLTAGKIHYLNSSGTWTETDADAIATSDGLLAITLGTAPSDGMLLRGFFDAHTYLSNFVSGLSVYLSTTAGAMDTTQPAGTGDVVRCVGYCTNTANVIYFNPSSTTIELS